MPRQKLLKLSAKQQIGIVWWDDAWADTKPHVKAPSPLLPYPKCTTGFIVADEENGILLAHELNGSGFHEYRTFIPRGMIRRIRKLRIPRR